jgi:hypothetical protein
VKEIEKVSPIEMLPQFGVHSLPRTRWSISPVNVVFSIVAPEDVVIRKNRIEKKTTKYLKCFSIKTSLQSIKDVCSGFGSKHKFGLFSLMNFLLTMTIFRTQ